jgi:cyclopropane-fatty-acyl-phospholipid synthase
MQLVNISFSHASFHGAHTPNPDYPRTLREWGRRLEANLTQDLIVKDYPALSDIHEYAAFKRKWEYLFAYAGAGFAKGYITCHMLTFIREVSSDFLVTRQFLSD